MSIEMSRKQLGSIFTPPRLPKPTLKLKPLPKTIMVVAAPRSAL